MQSSQNEQERTQVHIEVLHNSIALGDALDRLNNNPDFQLLIYTHMVQNETLRISSLLASPNLLDPAARELTPEQSRAYSNEKLLAISHLRLTLLHIQQMSDVAKETLAAEQSASDEQDGA